MGKSEAKGVSNTQVGEVHTPPVSLPDPQRAQRAVTFPF